jgi:hypothetical protein
MRHDKAPENPCNSAGSAAAGAALESDLSAIEAATASVPLAIRAAILAMIRAAQAEGS